MLFVAIKSTSFLSSLKSWQFNVRNVHDQLALSHISCFIIILNITTGEICEADNDAIVAFLVSKTGQ